MKIGMIGSGFVGRTLGARFRDLGHDVTIGSRDAAKPEAVQWADATGGRATDFAGAAEDGELLVNATPGTVSLDVLTEIGAERLDGKILWDLSNPLDFSRGFPPFLSVANQDSLAEQLQRAFPAVRIVKAFNTVTVTVMVAPEKVGGGEHDVFLAGNDDGAKAQVRALIEAMGWRAERVRDLGGLDGARALEMYMPLWLRLMGTLGTAQFNVRIVGTE
ncbi:NADPH-dependent F420 reductase [Sinomonas gamaensis]|uniref:NADPH-dependent F420 reductase n=1 Tax=Sinomonas gamaensis TaxID=2565624 RepID=UPI001107F584|nr:NAD(P)-binding domain-containing protein [Sinomonas gamaensis]